MKKVSFLLASALISTLLFQCSIVKAQVLGPGVYVAARDLKLSPIGTHQYVILVPEITADFKQCRDLGDGSSGMIVGGQAIDERLQAAWFDSGDVAATREHVNPKKYVKALLPDYDAEVVKVKIGDRKVDDVIRQIIGAVDIYVAKEKQKNISYPNVAKNIGNKGINSNSWAQSLIEHTLGKNAVPMDFTGFDPGKAQRIGEEYFKK